MKKYIKFISWLLIAAIITYHLPKDVLAITSYDYNGDKAPNKPADWLNFSNSKFSITRQGQETKITHQWGVEVKNGSKTYKYNQDYTLSSQDYNRTFSHDPGEVKFYNKEKDLDKIKLRVFKSSDQKTSSFAKNFGLLVENVDDNTQFVVGMFYIDENKDTLNTRCIGKDRRLDDDIKNLPASEGDLMTKWNGDVQGDSASMGLCAFSPDRVKKEPFPESKDAQDPFFYIFNLNSYIKQNAPILGQIESSDTFVKLNPTPEQKKKCNKTANEFYLTKPLAYGKDGVRDEKILELRDALKEYSDDSKVKGEIGKRIEKINYTVDDDKKLFEQYYRSDPSHDFPDQLMNAGYALNFQDLYTKAELDKVIAEYYAGYKIAIEHADTAATIGGATIAASALKVGAVKASAHLAQAFSGSVAAAASVAEGGQLAFVFPEAAAATGGTSVVGAIFTPIVIAVIVVIAAFLIWVAWKAWTLNRSVDEYFKSLFMIAMAWYYALMNKAYQECTGSWTDEKYSSQQEAYSKISLLKAETDKEAKEAMGIIFEDNLCPESKWNAPTSWFRASLCGLGVALWRGGKSLMTFAMAQLAVVLGTKYTRGY